MYENDAKACDLALHIDNQFRPLREDMIWDLQEEILSALAPEPLSPIHQAVCGVEDVLMKVAGNKWRRQKAMKPWLGPW